METHTASKVRRAIRHMRPSHIVKTFLTKRAVQKVAGKYGLVYFGHVDPSEDGATIIRGHTVSPSQLDNHYTVGTIQGYDVAFIQRNSLRVKLDAKEQRCHWLIVSIQLKTHKALPHVYVGPIGEEQLFQSTYPQLKRLMLGNTAPFPQKFTANFCVYGRPSDVLDVEWLIPPSTCAVLADYFGSMSFEVEGSTLYIYNENKYPTGAVLDSMLENGIWLAKSIDMLAGTNEAK